MSTVTNTKSYNARGFSIGKDETVTGAFDDFSRADRSPRLVPVMAGERLPVLTDEKSGMIYARKELEGVHYAIILMPGAWELVKAPARPEVRASA